MQIVLTFFSGLIFVVAPYLEMKPTSGFSLYDVGIIIGLACLIAAIGCFFVFLIKNQSGRKQFLLPGIRNIFLIPSALIVSKMHYMGWLDGGVPQLERYDVWQMEYLLYALIYALFVLVIFSLITTILQRYESRKNDEKK